MSSTTKRWGGHPGDEVGSRPGLVRLVGAWGVPPDAVRVTLKFHPVRRGGVPGIELDARLGPVGLAGVPQQRRRNSGAKVDGTIGIIIEVWHNLSFFPYNSPKPWLIIYIYHSHSTHQQRRLHAAAQHAYGTMQAIEVRGTSQYFFLSIHDDD